MNDKECSQVIDQLNRRAMVGFDGSPGDELCGKAAQLLVDLAQECARADYEAVETSAALWRIMPDVHSLEGTDPFEGPGETYHDAYHRAVERVRLLERLIVAKDEYIALLGEELNETVPIAFNHHWRSSRGEAGVVARTKIAQISDEIRFKPSV